MADKLDRHGSWINLTLETKCSHCGKMFERFAGGEWGYRKRGKKGAYEPGVYYCTYSCMRAAQKKRSGKK